MSFLIGVLFGGLIAFVIRKKKGEYEEGYADGYEDGVYEAEGKYRK